MDVYISFLQDPGPRPFVATTMDSPLGALDPYYLSTASDSEATGHDRPTKSIRETLDSYKHCLAKMRQRLGTHLKHYNLFSCGNTNREEETSFRENFETRDPTDYADEHRRSNCDNPSGVILINDDDPPCYEAAINMPQPCTIQRQTVLLNTELLDNTTYFINVLEADDCVNYRFYDGRKEKRKLTTVVGSDVSLPAHDWDSLPSYETAQAMSGVCLERTLTMIDDYQSTTGRSWICFCECPTLYQLP